MKGHVRKRGSKWCVVLDIGRGPDGKRRQKWHSGYRTRKDAETAMARLLTDVNRGTYVAPERTTVAEWLQTWLQTRETAGRAPATILRYRQLIEDRIVPALGSGRLADLRPSHLERHYAAELRSRARIPRPKNAAADWQAPLISPRTVYFEHQLLHAALKHAVRQGVLHRNPADAVTPPAPGHGEQSVLSPLQVSRIFEALRDHRLGALYHLAASTGMRQGELLGLRWADLDLDGALLQVRVQRQYLPRQGVRERPTKEHRGARVVELTDAEVDVLRAHRLRLEGERGRAGSLWREHGLVFPSDTGTPMWAANLRRFHRALLARLGLPYVRPHDLRHTAATLLLRADGGVKVAQERLGHADPATTLRMYGHVLPGGQREATARVLDEIRRAGEGATEIPRRP